MSDFRDKLEAMSHEEFKSYYATLDKCLTLKAGMIIGLMKRHGINTGEDVDPWELVREAIIHVVDEGIYTPRVYASRGSEYLRPGDGSKVNWSIGEVVKITSGIDRGRLFKVLSTSRTHDGAPGEFVREGIFTDEPGTTYAKRERQLWFAEEMK